MAGFVHAVVGAAGALQQPRGPLGRSHLDDQINIAPINAEIEAGSGDDGAQAARCHRRLDLLPGFGGKAAMVNADRQRLVIFVPQVAKNHFGNGASVDENNGQPRLFDAPHHGACRPAAIVPGPGNAVFGRDDLHHRRRAGIAGHQRDRSSIGIGGEPALIAFGVGDGCRQADAAQPGGETVQPRQGKTQLVTALRRRKGVDFIDDDGLHPGQHRRGIGIGDQQRQRFGRGQQDMRRAFALALLGRRRGIASARFDANIEADVGDRGQQIAPDIGSECL